MLGFRKLFSYEKNIDNFQNRIKPYIQPDISVSLRLKCEALSWIWNLSLAQWIRNSSKLKFTYIHEML